MPTLTEVIEEMEAQQSRWVKYYNSQAFYGRMTHKDVCHKIACVKKNIEILKSVLKKEGSQTELFNNQNT